MRFLVCLLILLNAYIFQSFAQSGAQKIDPQDLLGAWTIQYTDSLGTVTGMAIVTERYWSACRYDLEGRRFLYAIGGLWSLDGDIMSETMEFNTKDPSMVGKRLDSKILLEDDRLTFLSLNETWTRVDDGTPGKLANAWLITGRERGGKMTERTPGPRKTMKILSGTRFQWIAYNSETAEFFGPVVVPTQPKMVSMSKI